MDSTAVFLEPLKRISASINPARGFHAGLKDILGIMAQGPVCVRPHLLILDPEAHNLHLYVSESAPRSGQVVYTPGTGVTGQVFSTGRPVIVEKILGHPIFLCKFFERTTEEMGRLAFISVPVLSPGKQILGSLSMDTPCAPMQELQIRCQYLEIIAGIIASLSAYAQQDALHQQTALPPQENQPRSQSVIASSKVMQMVLELAAKAGVARGPVLITGDPGVGKEHLAAAIHAASARRDLPMLHFDCTGHTADVAERDLFGYRKGAFPGASQTCKGLLELARSSSLFLGSIENLPLETQTKLVQALQDQKFFRVGGGQPIELDIKLICSASQPLEKLAEEGRFSSELFSRLSNFTISVPPLREHPEDILPLAMEFLKTAPNSAGRQITHISGTAQDLLLQYSWPGNIRELRVCIEQATRICADTILHSSNLPSVLHSSAQAAPVEISFNDAVARFEKELLTDALRRSQGNMLQAARTLKASYRIINYKVKKYGIDPRSFMVKG